MNELKILLANDWNRFRPSETLKGVAGWALELVVEPGSQTTRVEFTLSPTGEEILLHADAQAHARSR